MKRLIFILIFLSSFGLLAEKPVVAVWEIDNKTAGKNKLSQYDAELIADLMRDELIQADEFIVMSKDEMESAIAQHVKKSHQLNKDKKYAIEMGKQISARFVVTSWIKTDGKSFRMFAEITDTETGRSPRSGKAKFAMDDDSKDLAIAGLIRQLLGERDETLKPKKSKDQAECESARSDGSLEAWESYLEAFPEGECKVEANRNIKKMRKTETRQNRTPAYENQQNQYGGSSSTAASAATEQVGNREWSELSDKKMNFNEARNYCRKLRDGGNSDWRLPTIDELRTLIQSCPGTETFGACKVSEEEGCLSSACVSDRYCECGPNSMGNHSKLGDTAIIWSSSMKTKSNERVFVVDFLRGGISSNLSETRNNVRCTR